MSDAHDATQASLATGTQMNGNLTSHAFPSIRSRCGYLYLLRTPVAYMLARGVTSIPYHTCILGLHPRKRSNYYYYLYLIGLRRGVERNTEMQKASTTLRCGGPSALLGGRERSGGTDSARARALCGRQR
eukprot:2048227-Pleurochrysis_carterae.AAC.2